MTVRLVFVQVQLQLEIMDLETCVFVQVSWHEVAPFTQHEAVNCVSFCAAVQAREHVGGPGAGRHDGAEG